jgi:hypothetical protein
MINLRNKLMKFNGNEIVFYDNKKKGVAGISNDQPSELAKEIVARWNKGIKKEKGGGACQTCVVAGCPKHLGACTNYKCEYGCSYDEKYGWVAFNDCPIHD